MIRTTLTAIKRIIGKRRSTFVVYLALLVAQSAQLACARTQSSAPETSRDAAARDESSNTRSSAVVASPWSQSARSAASKAFFRHWGDGKAEVSSYAITTPRYGEPRDGTLILIYVSEPMNRQTWIKDDRADTPVKDRIQVLKLNQILNFRTGIYPYSVMTSVFAPVDDFGLPRFTPAKIAFSAQEWCGHVYQKVHPGVQGFTSEIRSYFSAEGERQTRIGAAAGALYEDGLLIQLRSLDGPFARNENPWRGPIIPTLWQSRRAHLALRPRKAVIETLQSSPKIIRYRVAYDEAWWQIDVESAMPRRILGWVRSDGEKARLLGSKRLPYWELNKAGDERYLEEIGLPRHR